MILFTQALPGMKPVLQIALLSKSYLNKPAKSCPQVQVAPTGNDTG